jgi:hypothetical protein
MIISEVEARSDVSLTEPSETLRWEIIKLQLTEICGVDKIRNQKLFFWAV